jgi:serine/threonine protein kinase
MSISPHWSQPAFSYSKVRYGHKSVLEGSRSYIFGGRSEQGEVIGDLVVQDLQNVEWVKPDTQGFDPCPREHHHLAVIGKRMYCFGGRNAQGQRLNDMTSLSIVDNTWHEEPHLGQIPAPVCGHAMACTKSRIYMFGGRTDEGLSGALYSYDVRTHEWKLEQPKGEAPSAREYHSMQCVYGRLIVYGGRSEFGVHGDVHVFDLATNTWIVIDDIHGTLPPPRFHHSAVGMKKFLVIFGGSSGVHTFNDMYRLDLEYMYWTRVLSTGRQPHRRCQAVANSFHNLLIIYGGRNDENESFYDTFILDLRRTLESNPSDRVVRSGLSSKHLVRFSGMQDFKQVVTLGTGSFGRVVLCKHIHSGEYYAIKMLRKHQVVKLKQVQHILNEKDILCAVEHPFVVSLKGYFKDDCYVYFAMEYVVGGEFFTHLRTKRRFGGKTCRFYTAQIVLALSYLHNQSIIYRDMKPENLLLDARGYLKITDFGFAKRCATRTWTLCGTPEYIAPEILVHKGHGKAVDWWALGILIFEMLNGTPPFMDKSPMVIYEKILEGKIDYPQHFSESAVSLISGLLQQDPAKRLGSLPEGSEDVRNHPYFKDTVWMDLLLLKTKPPWIPSIRNPGDHKHFRPYANDTEKAVPVNVQPDPFAKF